MTACSAKDARQDTLPWCSAQRFFSAQTVPGPHNCGMHAVRGVLADTPAPRFGPFTLGQLEANRRELQRGRSLRVSIDEASPSHHIVVNGLWQQRRHLSERCLQSNQ